MESETHICTKHRQILTELGVDFEDIEKTRKYFHTNAEGGFKEIKAKARILEYFHDIEQENIKELATTGLIIDIKGTAPPTEEGEWDLIALRADMDGLPMKEETGLDYASETDFAHMCGHDGHMATLIATGMFLKKHRDKFPSNKGVRLLFQPAEEGPGGAEPMIEEGCLEGVDEIYGYHNEPFGPEGTITVRSGELMAGIIIVEIEIEGKGGHGSEPAHSVDPITAAVGVHNAFHTIKSRNLFNTDLAAFTIWQFASGSVCNVIPRTAKMSGTIRYFSEDVKDKIVDRIQTLTEKVSAGFGCKGSVKFTYLYPFLSNHEKQTGIVMDIGREELGASAVNTKDNLPVMGSEDFSYYLQKIPGSFIFLNTVKDGEEAIPLHSSKVDYNDNVTSTGVYLYIRIIENRLGIKIL